MSTYFGRDIKELHCAHCSCPKEFWKPMDSYQSDRSCELYEDIDSEAYDLNLIYGNVSLRKLYQKCMKYEQKYSDLPSMWAAVKECMDVYEDLGIYQIRR